MEGVYTAVLRPFDGARHAAVLVHLLEDHVGMLYQDVDGRLVHLHLAWHEALRAEEPTKRYAWVDPALPPLRLEQVAAFCRLVRKRNQAGGIPYAFSDTSGLFNSDGTLSLSGTRLGATCASFVLAVFDRMGLALVDAGTWPTDRPADEQRQRDLVERMRAGGVNEAHVEAVAGEIGAVRVAPVEVAASARAEVRPAPFETVASIADDLAVWLRSQQCGLT